MSCLESVSNFSMQIFASLLLNCTYNHHLHFIQREKKLYSLASHSVIFKTHSNNSLWRESLMLFLNTICVLSNKSPRLNMHLESIVVFDRIQYLTIRNTADLGWRAIHDEFCNLNTMPKMPKWNESIIGFVRKWKWIRKYGQKLCFRSTFSECISPRNICWKNHFTTNHIPAYNERVYNWRFKRF